MGAGSGKSCYFTGALIALHHNFIRKFANTTDDHTSAAHSSSPIAPVLPPRCWGTACSPSSTSWSSARPPCRSSTRRRRSQKRSRRSTRPRGATACVRSSSARWWVEAMSAVLAQAEALVLDCFQIFIAPLEQELGLKSSHAVGRSHSAVELELLPAHRGGELRFELRRRAGDPRADQRRRGAGGRVPLRQDAHLPVSRPAVRHPRRQLSAHPRGLRHHAPARDSCSPAATSCSG